MSKTNEIKVGIFVIAGLVIFIFAYFFSHGMRVANSGYHISVVFKSISGVGTGSDVKYAGGLTVGEVSAVKIINNQVVLKLWIKNDVHVYKDTSITITSASLLGEKFINIANNGGSQAKILAGETVTASKSFGMGSMITEAALLLKSINNVLNGDKNEGLLKDLQTTMRNTTKAINSILESSKTDIKKTFKTFKQIGDRLNRLLGGLQGIDKKLFKFEKDVSKLVNTGNKYLPDAMKKFLVLIKKTDVFVSSLNNGKGLLTALIKDKKILLEFKFILSNLSKIIYKLKL